jgi:phosphoribosylformylglycinamidine synthase
MKPRVLILHANGINRDLAVAHAFTLAGAEPEIVHVNQLRQGRKRWSDYQILVIPGGFSYADVLGAGQLFALDLKTYFAAEAQHFIDSGKPVLGICNGFQTLVKTGLLPGGAEGAQPQTATLTFNAAGRFECRWVTLLPQASANCLWTQNLSAPIYCPIAHGEGRFIVQDDAQLSVLQQQQQIALRYAGADGASADEVYPFNPNGSVADIAAICNPRGNVLGLMPHPEDHVLPHQHPRWTRGETSGSGLPLFINAVKAVK